MNENLYASPEPVEEEFVLDERWQRNARSLRVAAWGMAVAAAGMVVLLGHLFILHGFMGGERPFSMEFLLPAGLGLIFIGMMLCLACGRKTARGGRWLIAVSAVLIYLPLLWFFFPIGYYFMIGFYNDMIMGIGLALWGVFLWQFARTMKIRRGTWLTGLAICLWATAAAAEFFRHHESDFSWVESLLSIYFYDIGLYAFILGFAACSLGMMLLCATIFRGLRVSQKNGERK